MITKTSMHEYIHCIVDPRSKRQVEHLLSDIVIITVLAVICGAESWDDIEEFGKSKESFLNRILRLPSGIPSHDTFNRVISTIVPSHFQEFFTKWVTSIKHPDIGKEVISIDGKTMRRTKSSYENTSAVHIVSAWANSNKLTLGQVKTASKSNEITAIPELLNLLDIEGCVVTIDAMGCQKKIANQIVKQGGDYILGLKDNHPKLKASVEKAFLEQEASSIAESQEKNRGREEKRICSVINDLVPLPDKQGWTKLNSIIRIESHREVKGRKSMEYRYYISSLDDVEATDMNSYIRGHWGIENSLHWVLDVDFNEDYQRKRQNNAAQNFAVINKMAHNIINKDKSKGSIKRKRLKAGWNDKFLEKLIDNIANED